MNLGQRRYELRTLEGRGADLPIDLARGVLARLAPADLRWIRATLHAGGVRVTPAERLDADVLRWLRRGELRVVAVAPLRLPPAREEAATEAPLLHDGTRIEEEEDGSIVAELDGECEGFSVESSLEGELDDDVVESSLEGELDEDAVEAALEGELDEDALEAALEGAHDDAA